MSNISIAEKVKLSANLDSEEVQSFEQMLDRITQSAAELDKLFHRGVGNAADDLRVYAGAFIGRASGVLEPEDANTDFTGNFMLLGGVTVSGTVYNVGGMASGVLQWGASNSDGKFYAGAGVVVLDASGMRIISSTAASVSRALTFTNSDNSINYGGLFSYVDAGVNTVRIHAQSTVGNEGLVGILAESPSGSRAKFSVALNDGAGGVPSFIIQSNAGFSALETSGFYDMNLNTTNSIDLNAGGDIAIIGAHITLVGISAITGTLAVTSTITGSNLSGTNTGDETAAGILTKIKTVDGSGSGLDADLLDGHDTSYFQIAGSYQPLDTDLTAIAALVSAADKLPYSTGSGTWALADFSSTARTLLDDANVSAMRTTLGVAIGSNVQAWDADLDTIAGLTATTDNFIQSKGSAWASRTIAQVKTDLGLTGTNSGDITLGTIGASPNGNGASLSAQVLTLQPADSTNGGIIANATQTIPGAKTFAAAATMSLGLSLTNSEVRTGSITLTDDTATSFTPNKPNGMILVGMGGTGWGGLVWYNTGTPTTGAVSIGANTTVGTGALAGTTGTDARLNISCHTDGKIYIENRSGASKIVFWTLL